MMCHVDIGEVVVISNKIIIENNIFLVTTRTVAHPGGSGLTINLFILSHMNYITLLVIMY